MYEVERCVDHCRGKQVDYPSAAACLAEDPPALCVHLNYPLRLRKRLRSANLLVLEPRTCRRGTFNPEAHAAQKLIGLIERAFLAAGGDFNAGRRLRELLGDGTELAAEIIALQPGHAYLRLPLRFASSLEPRLLNLVGAEELASLRNEVEAEIATAGRWGTTFTLIQALESRLAQVDSHHFTRPRGWRLEGFGATDGGGFTTD